MSYLNFRILWTLRINTRCSDWTLYRTGTLRTQGVWGSGVLDVWVGGWTGLINYRYIKRRQRIFRCLNKAGTRYQNPAPALQPFFYSSTAEDGIVYVFYQVFKFSLRIIDIFSTLYPYSVSSFLYFKKRMVDWYSCNLLNLFKCHL